MDIKQVKQLLDNTYGIDISRNVRDREYVYARRVFSKICKEFGYTYKEIGATIDSTHATIIHHIKNFDTIRDTDFTVYRKLVRILNSSKRLNPDKNLSESLDVSYYEEVINELQETISEQSIMPNDDDLIELINIASRWDSNVLKDFIETRLKPFDRMNNQ